MPNVKKIRDLNLPGTLGLPRPVAGWPLPLSLPLPFRHSVQRLPNLVVCLSVCMYVNVYTFNNRRLDITEFDIGRFYDRSLINFVSWLKSPKDRTFYREDLLMCVASPAQVAKCSPKSVTGSSLTVDDALIRKFYSFRYKWRKATLCLHTQTTSTCRPAAFRLRFFSSRN